MTERFYLVLMEAEFRVNIIIYSNMSYIIYHNVSHIRSVISYLTNTMLSMPVSIYCPSTPSWEFMVCLHIHNIGEIISIEVTHCTKMLYWLNHIWSNAVRSWRLNISKICCLLLRNKDARIVFFYLYMIWYQWNCYIYLSNPSNYFCQASMVLDDFFVIFIYWMMSLKMANRI